MSPDDPRHGSRTGYQAGCREECCRRPQRVALKLYRMGRTPAKIDPTGTRRRLEALIALGWTGTEIAEACGRTSKNWVPEVRKSQKVVATTAERVRVAYEQMSRQRPEGPYRIRLRRMAERHGYQPPEAWWDIDDPAEDPDPGYADQSDHARAMSDDHDPVVVDRILGGDRSLVRAATKPERMAVVARWPGTYMDLERLTGWKLERYRREVAESA